MDAAMATLEKAAGLLMLGMILVITTQLVARNFLRISTPWTEDTAKLLLIWMTFLGSPVVLYRGEHLTVDLIYSRLTGYKRAVVDLLIVTVILVFCVIVVRLGISLCTNRIILRSTTAAAGIPRVWMFSALPVGGGLMFLVGANHLLDSLLSLFFRKNKDGVAENDGQRGNAEAKEDKSC